MLKVFRMVAEFSSFPLSTYQSVQLGCSFGRQMLTSDTALTGFG
jgi:hypothetical protein